MNMDIRVLKKRFCLSVLVPLFSFFFSSQILAVPEVPEATGFGGFFFVGAGYTEVRTNTAAGHRFVDVGEKTVSSLTDSPETSDDFHVVFGGEFTYTLGNRSQFFFGTSLEDLVTLDGALQLGWRKQTEQAGIFQTGILFAAVPNRVWEDPYQTGSARADTDRDSAGLRFAWDRIFGSMFEWEINFRNIEIDTEQSGQNLDPIYGTCDLTCQADLERDGDYINTSLAYSFRSPGNPHIVRPQLSYRTLDSDGDSQSYDGWTAQVTYSYLNPKLTFAANIAWVDQSYDRANPIYDNPEFIGQPEFGQKQDFDGFVIDANVIYTLPFESRKWKLLANVGYGDLESDIEFLDNRLGTGFPKCFLCYRQRSQPQEKTITDKKQVSRYEN